MANAIPEFLDEELYQIYHHILFSNFYGLRYKHFFPM